MKFLVCKSTPQVIYESLECLGGNGYTEDLPLARYYREAPLNAIWEGSGNVMALDVLRAAGRHPEAAMDTLSRLVRTASQAFNVAPLAQALERTLKSADAERRARFLCEGLARIAALAALVDARLRLRRALWRDTAGRRPLRAVRHRRSRRGRASADGPRAGRLTAATTCPQNSRVGDRAQKISWRLNRLQTHLSQNGHSTVGPAIFVACRPWSSFSAAPALLAPTLGDCSGIRWNAESPI